MSTTSSTPSVTDSASKEGSTASNPNVALELEDMKDMKKVEKEDASTEEGSKASNVSTENAKKIVKEDASTSTEVGSSSSNVTSEKAKKDKKDDMSGLKYQLMWEASEKGQIGTTVLKNCMKSLTGYFAEALDKYGEQDDPGCRKIMDEVTNPRYWYAEKDSTNGELLNLCGIAFFFDQKHSKNLKIAEAKEKKTPEKPTTLATPAPIGKTTSRIQGCEDYVEQSCRRTSLSSKSEDEFYQETEKKIKKAMKKFENAVVKKTAIKWNIYFGLVKFNDVAEEMGAHAGGQK